MRLGYVPDKVAMRTFGFSHLIYIFFLLTPSALAADQQGTSLITELIPNPHSLTSLFWVFALGILSSFTPCVYPLIPITLSIFGATGSKSRLQSFLLSLSYVLGIAVTYTTLGIIAGTTGTVFGNFLGNTYVILSIGAVFVLLSLFSLDILTLKLPGGIQSAASHLGGKGLAGAFIMGLASGVVAAPCVGPVLAGLLAYVATTKDTLWGGVLLFSYALGFGVIFLIVGTFSSLLQRIPRSGPWLNLVKYLLSSAILIGSLLFLTPLLNRIPGFIALTNSEQLLGIFAILGILLALISFKWEIKIGKFLSAVFLSFAIFYKITIAPVSTLQWIPTLGQALKLAETEKKPIIVDLYADWCAACKEIDHLVFSKDEVQRILAKSFISARIDFTIETEETLSITDRYSISGLPTILFLKPDGSEIRDLRITGIIHSDKFIELTTTVLEKN